MHPQKIKNLLKMNNEERVSYFIRHSCDFEEVWGLSIGKDQWIIYKDYDGDEVLPLWPHKELAELCAFDEHKQMNAKAERISIDNLFDDFLNSPDLDGVYYGIFFNKEREGLILPKETLKKELEDELEQYE